MSFLKNWQVWSPTGHIFSLFFIDSLFWNNNAGRCKLLMAIRRTMKQIHGRSRKMAEDKNLMGALVRRGWQLGPLVNPLIGVL